MHRGDFNTKFFNLLRSSFFCVHRPPVVFCEALFFRQIYQEVVPKLDLVLKENERGGAPNTSTNICRTALGDRYNNNALPLAPANNSPRHAQ